MQFKDIHGQEDLKRHFCHTIEQNRISHAQLFIGSEGSGTLPLALAYAQYVLCENRQEEDSCGTCSSCLKTTQLAHPDLHFVFPIVLSQSKIADDKLPEFRKEVFSNPYFSLEHWAETLGDANKKPVIGKNESEVINRKLSLKSFEGGYKIMIIWQIETMNTVTSNKLLKLLEEPPEKTLFILVGSRSDSLLSTIISRTQLTKINKLDDATLAKALVDSKNIPQNDASSIAALADGDFWKASEMCEHQEEYNIYYQNFVQWMRLCYSKNVVEVMDWSDETASKGREYLRQLLNYALHIFRQSIVGNYTDNQLVRLRSEELDFLKKFSPFINNRNINSLFEDFSEALFHIERNGNAKIVLTDLSIRTIRQLRR